MYLISVIIPAYNAASTLFNCLNALQSQSVPSSSYEIIVVDDGSTDNTTKVAEDTGVRVVSQPNNGAAAARNHGAQIALGELLLFTDADCVPAYDWVEQMSAPFTDMDLAGAKGVYLTKQSELTARFVQLEYEDKYERMRSSTQIDFVDTYSAAYRRDIFLAMGGFDTTFPGATVEDQEFSFRLAEAGYRLIFLPNARVWHQHDQSVSEYAHRKYLIGYWKPAVTRKYPNKFLQDSHTPQSLKAQMGLAALGGGFLGLGLVSKFWHAGFGRVCTHVGFGTWAIMLLSGWSLYKRILQKDPVVLMAAPGLLFVRAWSLGLGFFFGTLRLLRSRKD